MIGVYMLIESLNDPWVVSLETDCNGCCVNIDPRWRLITGQNADEAKGRGWLNTFLSDDRDYIRLELESAVKSGRPFRILARLTDRNGIVRRVMAVGAPQRDSLGAFIGYSGSIVDFDDTLLCGTQTAKFQLKSDSIQRYSDDLYRRRCAESLFETSRDGIVTVDMSGKIFEANPAFQQMLGYPLEELTRLTYQDITPEIWHDMEAAIVRQQILPRGESVEYEKEYIRKDGSIFPISLRTWTVTDEAGAVVGMRAFVRDISERKRSEAALRHSEALLHAVLDAVPDPIFLKDTSSRWVLANSAAFAVAGKPAEACIGKTNAEFLENPADARAMMENDKRIIATGESATVEEIVHTKSGARVFVSKKAPFRDADGNIVGLIGTARDITERKRAEVELQKRERRYRTLVDAVSAIMWSCPPSGLHIEPQPEWMAFTGQTAEEMLGDGWEKAIHPDDVAKVRSKWAEAVTRGELFANEHRIRRHDGEWRWMSVQVAPVGDADGDIVEWFGMHIDVTDRKIVEEKLLASEETLINAQRCARAGIWDINLITNQVSWSEPFYDLFGLPCSVEPSNENWIATVCPEDRRRVEAEHERALKMRGIQRVEFRILREGEARWLHSEGRVICDDEDRPVRVAGITWDITERKAAEEALRESQSLLKAVLDGSPDAIFLKDRKGRLLLANPTTLAAIGKPVEFCIGKTDEEFLFNPQDAGAIMANDRRIMETGKTERFDETVLTPQGVRCYRNSKAPYRDDAGNVIGLIGIARDVTELKAAETALRESEERFHASFAYAAIGFAMTGPDGKFVDANHAYCAITGYSLDELRNYAFSELIHPEDRSANVALGERMHAGEIPSFVIENRYIRKNGEHIWVRKSVSLIRHPDGRPRWNVVLVEDITEHKQDAAALVESEARFRALTQALPSLTWEADAAGAVTFVSEQWVLFTGMSAAELSGSGWTAALHPDDLQTVLQKWTMAVASRQHFETRYRLRSRDGAYRCFLARALPQLADDKQVMRWVGSCTDIDDMVKAQAALAEADCRKDEFLATLAHELRNPLAPIRNAAHILKNKYPDSQDSRLFDMLQRQVDHLTRLVDDLLEISRISQNKIELRKERVAVATFLRDALESCHSLIEKKGHRITVNFIDGPIWVLGDPVRLTQIAVNLINNSAKYTEAGGRIDIQVTAEGDQCVLRFRDSGVGIAAEMLPHVFELFTQVRGREQWSEGGLGHRLINRIHILVAASLTRAR